MTRWLLTYHYAVANNSAMELSIWVEQERGRQAGRAQHLGVKPPVVAGWISRRRPVPISHGAAIEQFTGGAVKRQQLFPNDWQRIWPELKEAADTGTEAEAGQGVA